MSYGVALRNGVPFTLGTIAALCTNATGSAWTPLSLWPDGISTPGMWSSPSTLPASFNDSTGTTPVATPGTVADSANPVGLALDIRAGATALADPGNHMLQASTTARPLLSARVNLLTYTEDFSYNPVISGLSSITADSVIGPYGDMDGTTLTEDTGIYDHMVRSNTLTAIVAGNVYTRSCFFKKGSTGRNAQFGMTYGGDSFGAVVDLDSGSIVTGVTGVGTVISSSVTTVGGWYFCSVSGTLGPSITACLPYEALSNKSTYEGTNGPGYHGDGTSYIYVFGRDFRAHSDLPVIYQSVPGNGSTYTSTGITPFQLYDGTDDGMATATFSAGTLIDGMDCLIPVRRDSGANAVCGLYESVAEANKVFGIAESGSSSGCVGSGAGTPTVWVDGTQLTGGTAVTRGTLHTALTVGDWHIVEFRNLDLSTWTASGFGLYTSYVLNGPRGDIMLFPSPADATERDNARQYLADKYGVTLP